MATYAALMSLKRVLEDVLHPTRHWILLDRKQIQTLHENVCSLLGFFEAYSHQISNSETDELEMSKIADACYAAEDIIESFVSYQILSGLPDEVEKSLTHFSQYFEKVREEMDSIEKMVMEIEEKMNVVIKYSSPAAGLSSRLAPSGNTTVVGLEDVSVQIMGRLGGDEPKLVIVPIVGMGGIGKTTLAKNVFDKPYIVEHFHIRAWVTVSQEYSVREILLTLLHGVDISLSDKRKLEADENIAAFTEKMSKQSDEKLREQLHQSLFGRRYLIVMDDVWRMDAWNEVKNFFPDNLKKSRILITSRLESDVAIRFGSDSLHQMKFLNEGESWDLFRANAFPRGACAPELKEIGEKIATSCKGLPLALVVIGGLLANSKQTREYWEDVAENLSSIINLGNDEQCQKILSLSYSHLPIHLKPCFLYMATFPEDRRIPISKLIKLWIAEGFLKPMRGKSLEEVAEYYLEDLIGRNLIAVHKRGTMGNMKSCIMHDLLRELCLRKAQQENFLCATRVYSDDIPPGMKSKRRLCINRNTKERSYSHGFIRSLQSASFARSLVCEPEWVSPSLVSNLKLLRVLDAVDKHSPVEIMQLVNLRYLALNFKWHEDSELASISQLWNLQTLIIPGTSQIILPPEIWKMTQLRHLEVVDFDLPDPPQCRGDTHYSDSLENLQTLSTIRKFRCTVEVLRRVQNLKKMKITYEDDGTQFSYYCLTNLVHLHKLESLTCNIKSENMVSAMGNIAFPCSLKKLTLRYSALPWADITIVGSLPNLEVLKLDGFAFQGPEWNAIEGQFQRLKFLLISYSDLQYWRADSTEHFPSLEHLVIHNTLLVEIPLVLAELFAIRLIELSYCKDSVIESAKQILEEYENLGNVGLRIQIRPRNGKEYYLTNDQVDSEP